MDNKENQIKKFYIADTHFGHKNILHFDKRPWHDISAMRDDMIELWNDKVRRCDEVYILGDFCMGTPDDWRYLLNRLNGKKFLIKGNHDLKNIPEDIQKMFVEICNYKEIHDGEHHVIMSHYPAIAYNHDTELFCVMLYGHVHKTVEFEALKKAVAAYKDHSEKNMLPYQGNLYNCWCGFYGFMPATLKEILVNKQNH